LHTGAPVVHEVFPGLQTLPQSAMAVQDEQLPLPSHTWLVPQLVPAGIIFWFLQTGVPVLQSKVPALQADPQAAPIVQETQLPFPSQTCPLPQLTPGFVFF